METNKVRIILYHEDGSLLSGEFSNTTRISPQQLARSPIRWDNPFLTFRSQTLPPAPPALTNPKSLLGIPTIRALNKMIQAQKRDLIQIHIPKEFTTT